MFDVTVRFPGFAGIRRTLLENPQLNKEINVAWTLIYRAYIRKRFYINSRGGGDWPPLKPATIAHRRGTTASILIDTGLLFAATAPDLDQGGLIQINEKGDVGISATLGNGGAYPDGVSIGDVAKWHHEGAGNLPVRKILVTPNTETLNTMRNVARRIIRKYGRSRN